MTVSSSTDRALLPGNGVTTVFPLPFRFFLNDDIQASLIDAATLAITPLYPGINYTLFGAGEPEVDGNPVSKITMTAAPATGKILAVLRVMPITQPTDIINQARFFPEIHENVFDRLTMLIQQVLGVANNALQLEASGLNWDAKGKRIINVADPVADQDAATRIWTSQFVGSLISQIQGPINNSANVFYQFPNGTAHVVQDLSGPIGASGIGYELSAGYRRDLLAHVKDFVSALDFPFDGTVAGDTAAMNALMASPHLNIKFPARVYYTGFQNETNNRTFYFEEGAIIDGVAHLAIGKGPDLGTAPSIIPCRGVTVLGNLTSTVRVGTIYAERVSADKFTITEVNAAYPNQTTNGGTSGVHIYYGCKDFDIGEIDVRSGTKDFYGLGIDVATTIDAAHRPTNIKIGKYRCITTGQQAALATAETVGVTIDEMYVESAGGIGTSIGSLRDERMTIRKLFLDGQFANAGTDGFYIRESRGHTLGELTIQSSKQIGFRVDNAASRNITVDRIRLINNTLEGARLESPVKIGLMDTTANLGVGLNIPLGGARTRIDTLVATNNNGIQASITAADVRIDDIQIVGPAGLTQFGLVLNAGAARFRNNRVEASVCSQGVRVLSAGPTYFDTMYLHDNSIGLATTGIDTQGVVYGKIDFSANTTDFNNLIAAGFREQRYGEDIRGDVSVTVNPSDSHVDQVFNTTLTANRTVTLGTTGARLGSEFNVIRTAAAGGAFNVVVGAKNLAAGQWCTVRYGTTGWRLVASGSL